MTRPQPPKFHRGGVRREAWVAKRIAFLQNRVDEDEKELYALVSPTDEETDNFNQAVDEGAYDDEWLKADLGLRAEDALEQRKQHG